MRLWYFEFDALCPNTPCPRTRPAPLSPLRSLHACTATLPSLMPIPHPPSPRPPLTWSPTPCPPPSVTHAPAPPPPGPQTRMNTVTYQEDFAHGGGDEGVEDFDDEPTSPRKQQPESPQPQKQQQHTWVTHLQQGGSVGRLVNWLGVTHFR